MKLIVLFENFVNASKNVFTPCTEPRLLLFRYSGLVVFSVASFAHLLYRFQPSRSVDVNVLVKYSHVSNDRTSSIVSVAELVWLIDESKCIHFFVDCARRLSHFGQPHLRRTRSSYVLVFPSRSIQWNSVALKRKAIHSSEA